VGAEALRASRAARTESPALNLGLRVALLSKMFGKPNMFGKQHTSCLQSIGTFGTFGTKSWPQKLISPRCAKSFSTLSQGATGVPVLAIQS